MLCASLLWCGAQLMATRWCHPQGEFLPADQFISLFAQATVEDVPDDHMYFAVRATYDIVPVHRKVKAMLANLHNQCLRHGATFTPEQVAELCEKVSRVPSTFLPKFACDACGCVVVSCRCCLMVMRKALRSWLT